MLGNQTMPDAQQQQQQHQQAPTAAVTQQPPKTPAPASAAPALPAAHQAIVKLKIGNAGTPSSTANGSGAGTPIQPSKGQILPSLQQSSVTPAPGSMKIMPAPSSSAAPVQLKPTMNGTPATPINPAMLQQRPFAHPASNFSTPMNNLPSRLPPTNFQHPQSRFPPNPYIQKPTPSTSSSMPPPPRPNQQPAPPPQQQQQQQVPQQPMYPPNPQKPLLPYTNTYITRLKEGNSSLLIPVFPVGKRKRNTINNTYAEVDEFLSDDDDDSDASEDGYGRRRSRRQARNERVQQRAANGEVPLGEGQVKVVQRRRALRKTKHDYLRSSLPYFREQAAQVLENLVPIKLDLEIESYKIRDHFMWNLKEKFLTPEKFAELMCEDLSLPYQAVGPLIVDSMKAQIQEHLNSFLQEVPADEDMRIVINLDVHLGTLHLIDRFEWDLASTLTPEDFARTLASDLGLGGECVPLVSQAIHSQLLKAKNVLALGGAAEDDEGLQIVNMLRDSTKPIETPIRDPLESNDWGPLVESLNKDQIDSMLFRLDNKNARKSHGRRDSSRVLGRGMRRATLGGSMESLSGSLESLGGGGGGETGWEGVDKGAWKCGWCNCSGKSTPAPMPGPVGPKEVCTACGLFYKSKGELPGHRKELYKS
ncbi:Chromatin structure remodeling complex protein sfh1 [Chytridiales sp. JEL 0842]|nr:Chromatin structure remodeling complex protein sfh1 [Chytridiales sp. JEL 0842]